MMERKEGPRTKGFKLGGEGSEDLMGLGDSVKVVRSMNGKSQSPGGEAWLELES